MSFLRYLKGWLGGAVNRAGTRRQPLCRRPNRLDRHVQPAIEQLECRELLSGLTVAILGSPTSGHSPEGKPIYLTSALKGTAPGVAYTYSWQVLKNNVAYTSTVGSVLPFAPNDDGTYQITLNVQGRNGSTATTSQTITVDDVAPTVYLSQFYSGTALTGLTFHATATSPSPVDRAAGFAYTWNFGDGTTGTGAAPMHVYATPGKYAVTLSVTDAGGGIQKTVGAIANIAAPRAPGLVITGMPAYGYSPEGTAVTLGSVLRGTTPGATYTYAWMVLKGKTAFASGTNDSIRFTPDDAGIYQVYLTVTDQFGTAVTRNLGLFIYDKPPTVQLSPLFTADLGTSITFSATVTDPGPLDMAAGFRYLWYFGDGTTSHDATPTHTYAKNGSYPVRVIVTNADGLSAAANALATVGKPVSAQFNGPSSVGAGTTTALVSFTKQAGGIGRYTYSYDFGNTGTFAITGSSSPSAMIPEQYVDSGPATLVVHGRITDSVGGYADYTTTIQINDTPPTPSITFTPTVDAGESGTFQGSATDPSMADTQAGFTYSWNFGDGSAPVTGANPSHPYTNAGTYTVTLTATDEHHVSGSTSVSLTVNPMPTATFSGPSSVAAGTSNAQVTFTNQVGGAGGYAYSYDFGNKGTFDIVGSPMPTATIPVSYLDSAPATVTVRGRITDSAGGYTDYTTTIQVTDPPPSPSITFTPTVDAGQLGNFQGTATDANTAVTPADLTYSWDFGDGSAPVTGANPTYTYANAGTYTIKLTVTDQFGISGSTSVSFTVNPLPTANFSGPPNVDAGTTTAMVMFTLQTGGVGSYTYSYDFGNTGVFNIANSTSSQATVPSSYLSTDGPHVIHARITDSIGGYTDYTFTINVNSV